MGTAGAVNDDPDARRQARSGVWGAPRVPSGPMSCGRYVASKRAREHLRRMSAIGVGARQIETVSGVGHSEQWHIRTGRRKRIHPETERAILGVCGLDRARGSRIPAGRTWELIECLLRAGVRQCKIAEAIGNKRSAPPSSRDAIRRRAAALPHDRVRGSRHRRASLPRRAVHGRPRAFERWLARPVIPPLFLVCGSVRDLTRARVEVFRLCPVAPLPFCVGSVNTPGDFS
jgi:hypothetical protein